MIQIKQLGKQVAPGFAVRDVSLNIARGESIALFGPSGCGKTTTLRLIAGFETPDQGLIVIDGRRVSTPKKVTPPHARNLSMVFQDLALWPHMRAAQHLSFVLQGRINGKTAIQERVKLMLEKTRLQDKAKAFPHQLSGGQRQRLALARALVVEPAILLLDEPLSNLDPHLRSRLLRDMRQLIKARKMTTVFVTHELQEAAYLTDRIAYMRDGQIQKIAVSDSCEANDRRPAEAETSRKTNDDNAALRRA